MSFSSIGDLASSMIMNQSRSFAKQSMARLTQELSTGRASQTGAQLGHDFSGLSEWEHSISSAQVRKKTLSEALTRAQFKQNTLQNVSQLAMSMTNEIDLVAPSWQGSAMRHASQNATSALDQMLSALNINSAGHSIFAGSGIDGPAVASLDAVLTSVKTAIGGAPTATDVMNAVDTWMTDPATGFPAEAFLGAADDAPSVRIDQTRVIAIPGRADDPAVQSVIRNLILAAVSHDDSLGLPDSSKRTLLQVSAQGLRVAEREVIDLSARVGAVEAEIERGSTRAGFELSTAQQLKQSALGIDEYETVTKLQSAELQLEKIYALTARSSRMSLLEYLR